MLDRINISMRPGVVRTARMYMPKIDSVGPFSVSRADMVGKLGLRLHALLKCEGAYAGEELISERLMQIDAGKLVKACASKKNASGQSILRRGEERSMANIAGMIIGRIAPEKAFVSIYGMDHGTAKEAIRMLFSNNPVRFNRIMAHMSRAGLNLSGGDFEDSMLRGFNLDLSDLTGVNLRNAFLRDMILTGTRLPYADLTKAVLTDCDLSFADPKEAKFDYSVIRYSPFTREFYNISRSKSEGTIFIDCPIIGE